MKTAALAAWVATALGGFTMLAIWLARGGLRQQREGRSRLRPLILFSHVGLAVAGLVAWLAYVVGDARGARWIPVALLPVVAGLGLFMFLQWLADRGAEHDRADPPAEQRLPVFVVAAHGVFALVTLVLVVAAALAA